MRSAPVFVILLGFAAGLPGSAAETPPTPKPAPTSSSGATPATAAGPSTPSAAAHPPAAASEPAPVPDRIDPTEKVHSDSEISFPVDI